jgi:hypothetical protein
MKLLDFSDSRHEGLFFLLSHRLVVSCDFGVFLLEEFVDSIFAFDS